jgi:hypothetical protein
MAGIQGQRSPGRPRKSLAELERSGTFRASRHSHLRDVSPPSRPAPPVPDALIAGLGVHGAAIVASLWTAHDFESNPAAQLSLRAIGQNVDIVEDPDTARPDRLRSQRFILDTFKHLNLEKA